MIEVFDKKDELIKYVANEFVSIAQKAIEENGKFVVALTGGSSPIDLHKLLATDDYQSKIDWEKVYIFWGDERWVPLEDDRSNAKMAFTTLLNDVNIPQANIFPMYNDVISPEEYAAEYQQFIKEVSPEGIFDLILLGMGDDGHTASLFPHQKVLEEQDKWVDAYYLEPQSMYRITLTAPLINQAKNVQIIVFGENKANAFYEVLQGEKNPTEYPTQLINPTRGNLVFLVDKAAASKIN